MRKQMLCRISILMSVILVCVVVLGQVDEAEKLAIIKAAGVNQDSRSVSIAPLDGKSSLYPGIFIVNDKSVLPYMATFVGKVGNKYIMLEDKETLNEYLRALNIIISPASAKSHAETIATIMLCRVAPYHVISTTKVSSSKNKHVVILYYMCGPSFKKKATITITQDGIIHKMVISQKAWPL